ncbi:MAG: hypothetical protein NTV21_17315 [Planctomycetota bacterium]|nr:hypothetical protein [Planctomycetota bacterium]
MRSAKHLKAALEAVGMREVEIHDEPQPLLSWRNQPVGESAEVIVRRRHIGATADDLGFLRRPNGQFEAIVSEILLGRFDLRWFAELDKRHAALAAAAGDAPEPAPAPKATREGPHKSMEGSVAATPRPAAQEPPRKIPKLDPVAPKVAAPELPATPGEERLELDKDLAAVLGAALKESKVEGCIPLVLGWIFAMYVSVQWESLFAGVFFSVVMFMLLTKRLKARQERMAAAAAAEFRSRFGSDGTARKIALRRLRNELEKLSNDRRRVVELLLTKLGG